MYQQTCYIVQPRSVYRVSLYGFGHVYCAFLLPLECTTLSVRPPFGGVAITLGNSDFAGQCSRACIYLEPPLFRTLTISYDRPATITGHVGKTYYSRICYNCETVCQGVIFITLPVSLGSFAYISHASKPTHSKTNICTCGNARHSPK